MLAPGGCHNSVLHGTGPACSSSCLLGQQSPTPEALRARDGASGRRLVGVTSGVAVLCTLRSWRRAPKGGILRLRASSTVATASANDAGAEINAAADALLEEARKSGGSLTAAELELIEQQQPTVADAVSKYGLGIICVTSKFSRELKYMRPSSGLGDVRLLVCSGASDQDARKRQAKGLEAAANLIEGAVQSSGAAFTETDLASLCSASPQVREAIEKFGLQTISKVKPSLREALTGLSISPTLVAETAAESSQLEEKGQHDAESGSHEPPQANGSEQTPSDTAGSSREGWMELRNVPELDDACQAEVKAAVLALLEETRRCGGSLTVSEMKAWAEQHPDLGQVVRRYSLGICMYPRTRREELKHMRASFEVGDVLLVAHDGPCNGTARGAADKLKLAVRLLETAVQDSDNGSLTESDLESLCSQKAGILMGILQFGIETICKVKPALREALAGLPAGFKPTTAWMAAREVPELAGDSQAEVEAAVAALLEEAHRCGGSLTVSEIKAWAEQHPDLGQVVQQYSLGICTHSKTSRQELKYMTLYESLALGDVLLVAHDGQSNPSVKVTAAKLRLAVGLLETAVQKSGKLAESDLEKLCAHKAGILMGVLEFGIGTICKVKPALREALAGLPAGFKPTTAWMAARDVPELDSDSQAEVEAAVSALLEETRRCSGSLTMSEIKAWTEQHPDLGQVVQRYSLGICTCPRTSRGELVYTSFKVGDVLLLAPSGSAARQGAVGILKMASKFLHEAVKQSDQETFVEADIESLCRRNRTVREAVLEFGLVTICKVKPALLEALGGLPSAFKPATAEVAQEGGHEPRVAETAGSEREGWTKVRNLPKLDDDSKAKVDAAVSALLEETQRCGGSLTVSEIKAWAEQHPDLGQVVKKFSLSICTCRNTRQEDLKYMNASFGMGDVLLLAYSGPCDSKSRKKAAQRLKSAARLLDAAVQRSGTGTLAESDLAAFYDKHSSVKDAVAEFGIETIIKLMPSLREALPASLPAVEPEAPEEAAEPEWEEYVIKDGMFCLVGAEKEEDGDAILGGDDTDEGDAEAVPSADSDLESLLAVLPDNLRHSLQEDPDRDRLVEIVVHIDRSPHVFFSDGKGGRQRKILRGLSFGWDNMEFILKHLPEFNTQNRSVIEGTLHRISANKSAQGDVLGLTMRLGKHVPDASLPLLDLVSQSKMGCVLMIGPPGRGKTTLLRDFCAQLSKDVHVVIVDKSNEIAGEGDREHPSVGDAFRLQIPEGMSADEGQEKKLIEALENHSPDVIVADEISTRKQVDAICTISRRGASLLCTCHGEDLRDVRKNQWLSMLMGRFETAAVSDDQFIETGSKFLTQMVSPPLIKTAIELKSQRSWVIHHNVKASVQAMLEGKEPEIEWRKVDEKGRFWRHRGKPADVDCT